MKRFEYEVITHPASAFQQLVYFCTSDGECYEEATPTNVMGKFRDMLNGRGAQGWELVNVKFSPQGVVSFWKRECE